VIRVTLFTADGVARCGGEELIDAGAPEGGSIWIDLQGTDRRYEGWLREWGCHPLAIEDTFTLQHHPKVEEYGDTLFLIVRGLDFNVAKPTESDEISTLKLAAFLSANRLITVHRAPLRSLKTVIDRIDESGRALPGGVAHALWATCDELIDFYLPLIESISDEIEDLEEEVVERPSQDQLESVLTLRRKLATLRRIMLPHRQVFSHLAASRGGLVDDAAALSFRDIQDNVLRLTDAIEQQRDLLNNVKDTYLSVVAQRTNDIMRVLTVFSAIVLPLSLVAGIYGMNFQHMPELASKWGYPAVLVGMASIAGGMLLWFRRKGWL